MMTYSLRNKTIALAMAIIFALSLVMMPVGIAFAGDVVDFIGAYRYVEPDDEKAGSVTVRWDSEPLPTTEEVYFEITLPNGVEFASPPAVRTVYGPTAIDEIEIEGVKHPVHHKGIESENVVVRVISSTPTTLKVYADVYKDEVERVNLEWSDDDNIKFDFSNLTLDIDDDFRGDLRVDVEVHGFDGDNNRVWVESDTITIARVGEKEAIVTAEDPEAVSVGQDREAAKITIKELLPNSLLGSTVEEKGYLTVEMRTEGVKFDFDDEEATCVKATHLGIEFAFVTYEGKAFKEDGRTEITGRGLERIKRIVEGERIEGDRIIDVDECWIIIEITEETKNFTGKIEITPMLDIDPDVRGEIRVRVSGYDRNEEKLDATTLPIATVGDVRAKIDDVKYNDGIIYAGVNEEELDTEFKVVTIGGVDFKVGDEITFELSAGKLKAVEVDNARVEKYDECDEHEGWYEAFYVHVNEGGVDEIEISGLEIKLDADVEAGELKLRVGGDYGDLGEVVIARIEKPLTATAEEATEVVRDSSMNRVADIVITEAAEGVLDEDITKDIYLQLPEGIIFSKEPEVEVTRGDLELGDIRLWHDNEVLEIVIDDGSTKESTITISDIYYTVKPWAAFGDVEVRIGEELEEEVEGEDMFTTVVNARVVDERLVTATFTKADDEVEIRNGRALLRVNVLCDVMGLEKSWDPVNRTAYFIRPRDGRVVAFPIGENKMILNGIEVPISQGGVIINDFTHVPILYIQMAFGGELDWDDATKTVTYTFTK
ncbi:copper amine oxidase N-terminal domain-containing protein [Peptococcaceae bacterium]|nr:copper amine oxidase N-terminal domain-containing protein [Peptococcaceae bacterium]